MRRVPGWPLLGLLAACSTSTSPVTQVVVSIDSDLAPATTLARVDVELLRADGDSRAARTLPDMYLRPLDAPADAAAYALPLTFAITPGGLRDFVVRVRGWGSTGRDAPELRLLVEQRVSAHFEQGTTSLLRIFLGELCVDRCLDDDGGRVCYPTSVGEVAAGECGPIDALSVALTTPDVAPAEIDGIVGIRLPAWTPTSDAGPNPGPASDSEVQGRDAGPAPLDGGEPADGGIAPRPVDGSEPPDEPVDLCAAAACSSAYPCEPVGTVGYTCRGQLAEWPMPSRVADAKFRPSYDADEQPGVVLDLATGLQWEQARPAVYAGCTGTVDGTVGARCTLAQAETYCDDLELGAHDDWRLPSLIELLSIVDESVLRPAIDVSFPGTLPVPYWTSSPYLQTPSAVWVVNFETGNAGANFVTNGNPVRCVRSAPLKTAASEFSPNTRYARDLTSGTVSDTRTGLTWQHPVELATRDWSEAQSYCAALSGDFRLPTMKELATLLDPGRTQPAIDPVFEGTPADVFWSSSPWLAAADTAWQVNFTGDLITVAAQSNQAYVRCVR